MVNVAEHARPQSDKTEGSFLSKLAERASLSMVVLALSGFISAKVFGADLSSVEIFDLRLATVAPVLALLAGIGVVYVVSWIRRRRSA